MQVIRSIGRLRKYLSKNHLKIMVNAFVMRRLLIILPKQDKNKNSQNRAAAWFRAKKDLSV